MDADADGHHIATLLLTFFYRYLRPLVDGGYVYVAQPPLFRVDVAKETFWALDERERDRILEQARKKNPRATVETTRFKGLGEMMPKVLWETTLNPRTRRLLRVDIWNAGWIDQGHGSDAFNRHIAADPDFEAAAFPFHDGVLIGRRIS